jgi:hypothetical protein
MNRRVAAGAVLFLVAAGGSAISVKATGGPLAASRVSPATATHPVITVQTDAAVAHPAAQPVTPPVPHVAAQDAIGAPHALPAFVPGSIRRDVCESQSTPHPVGFTQMGGTGTDTITQRSGSSVNYDVYKRHAPLQWVCLSSSPDGTVDIQGILQPVGGDASTYEFTMGPSGLTLVAVQPGRSTSVNDMIPVGVGLGSWPATGCSSVRIQDLGPRHASIDDTFCFSPNGVLRHVDLHERATDANGVSRDLEASLDDFSQG